MMLYADLPRMRGVATAINDLFSHNNNYCGPDSNQVGCGRSARAQGASEVPVCVAFGRRQRERRMPGRLSQRGGYRQYGSVAAIHCALLSALCILAHPANAQSTWTGATSSDWSTASNWINGVPHLTSFVTIDTTSPRSTELSGDGFGDFVSVGGTGSGQLAIIGGTLSINDAEIGEAGTGVLIISDGGGLILNGTGLSLGFAAGGIGTVTITDTGSTLTAPNVTVGVNGKGTLTVAKGGSITTKFLSIGAFTGSVGTATVTGTGSSVSTGDVTIGSEGSASLILADHGVLSVAGDVDIAQNAGKGMLIIGAPAGAPAVAPGRLEATTVTFGGGAGVIAFNHTGTNYAFDPAITGVGSVNVLAGTTIFNGDQSYTGSTTISGGSLLVNGSLAAPVAVHASGTLGGTGTINNDLTNAGTVSPGDGWINQKLTVNGNYIGTGGTLAIQTILGDDASPTNQLVISGAGHTTSGITRVVVTNFQGIGPGARTDFNGIPIIVTEGGATTGAGTFSGGGRAGPFQYVLFQGPSAGPGDRNIWYLRSHHDSGTGGPLLPPGEPIPLYRPEVSIYSAMAGLARQQELTTLGTFHDRNGDQRLAGGGGNRTAAWGRLFGQHLEQSHWGHAGASFEGNTGGLQSGLDVAQWVNASGHQDRFGLFAAHARTTGDVRGFSIGVVDAVAGRADLDGTSVGAYWTHLAPSGWYTDAVLMGTRLDGQGAALGDEVDISGYGAVASIEGGYPIVIAPGVRLEPQAQLVYQHINFHDVDDPFSHVAYDTPDALFGRIGVRLSADLLPLPWVLRPYLKASVWQDFTETDTIRFSGIHQILSRHEATTLELGGGIIAQLSPGVGLWVSAEYTTDIGGSDESRESVRGTAGLRVVW